MIMDLALWAGGIIITGIFGLIGWSMRMIHGKIDAVANDHEDLKTRFDGHRLHVAETFTTKADIKEMKDDLIRHLVRIEGKVDSKQ